MYLLLAEVPEEEPKTDRRPCTCMTIGSVMANDSDETDESISQSIDSVSSPHSQSDFDRWSLDSEDDSSKRNEMTSIFVCVTVDHHFSYNDEGGGTEVHFDTFNIYTDEEYAAPEDALNEVQAITDPIDEKEGREIHNKRVMSKLYMKAVRLIRLLAKPIKTIRHKTSVQG